MGRGRGKGKKLSASSHDDAFEEEEKIPVQKRRGRPQKPLKEEAYDEEEPEKVVEEEEDGEDAKSGITTKEPKSPVSAENGTTKRKRNVQVRDKLGSVKEETGGETRSSTEDSSKPNGFRHNGSRRKSKPRRAAEVGVECM